MLACLFAILAQGASPETVPAKILDLRNFKLTLPVGKPTEIKTPELAGYRHETSFHVTPDGKGVAFRAPCGGATTKGSSYPRSELREMDGKGKARWSTTRGRHRMFLRQAITHLPDRKRHVVAGQIHDDDEDVVMIRLEGRKLFVEIGGKDGPVLTRDYTLGTVFTVELIAESERIKVFYNGARSAAADVPAKRDDCFFKAGCYTQSNPSKGDAPEAYGEVVIYDLRVTHE